MCGAVPPIDRPFCCIACDEEFHKKLKENKKND